MSDDTRDRVIAVGEQVKHLDGRMEAIEKKIGVIHDKVTKAEGAYWGFTKAAAGGGVVGALLVKYLPFLPIVR